MRHPRSKSDLPLWWLAAILAGGCGFNSSNNKVQPDAGGGPVVDAAPPPMIDAPTGTTPPGNTMCFGPTGWQVCLDAPPAGAITLNGPLDTDKSDMANPCLKAQPASWTNALQPDACFIVADKITVMSINATGKRPLVLVGGSSIAVQVLLDVGSRRIGMPGAGSQSTECQPFKRNPGIGMGGGGGAGGSFGGPGGNGGNGDGGNHQNGQSADGDVGQPARLRGGCAGQPGGNAKPGDGGAGGGAVYLVSAGPIKVTGTIDASGAGGTGGAPQNGGSGGGSGGLIVVYSPMSIGTTATTLIFATGGGGGGGGAAAGLPVTAKGGDGQDPIVAVPIAIAGGGSAGQSSDGNDGGSGGGGFPSTSNDLDGTGGDDNAGGGGGGGGAGFVIANLGLAPAAVAPAAQAM